MPKVRREFLEQTDDARTGVSDRAAREDYALVIGVNDYPQLRPLRGALADARAFAAWLVDPEGGALRAENVHTILSTADPLGPIGLEINDALEDVLQRAGRSGGRRFYFYFSGHGCVGDRANDLALCLANWSSFRRRAALSSEAWLDVIVRSGIFDEVAFFFDCCRVWATRAVGLPPHVDFPKPVERERGTRVFLAYATEFQRAAVEIDTGPTSELRESRGIFTQVLIDGLRGMARALDEVVTAASLKKYVEKATEKKAREFGLHQRAEVVNGFEETASFGKTSRSSSLLRPDSSGVKESSGNSPCEFAAEEASSVVWLASYIRFRVSGQFELRRPFVEDATGTCRLLLMVLPQESRRRPQTITVQGSWSIVRGDGSVIPVDVMPRASAREGMIAFSARLAPGAYQLRTTGGIPRAIAVRLFPGWTTMLAFDDAVDPHFENTRLFLIQGFLGELPDIKQIDYAVAQQQMLLNSVGQAFSSGNGMRFIAPNDNPLLGLLEAHRMARQDNPDASRIETLADQLETAIGVCPDIDALRLRAAMIRRAELPAVHAADPPMLREGLLAFVEASHQRPELIPSASTLESACIERFVDSPLTTWDVCPDEYDGDDWLTKSIEDEVTRHNDDTVTLDARTMARELGVPTQAVATRIEVTRERQTRKNKESAASTPSVPPTAPNEDTKREAARLPAIPGYSFERLIGKGGMGRVYLAKHEATGTRVAVKMMSPQSGAPKDARERFLREIHHTAVLKHPRLIALIDQGEIRRSFYFVMPYCERGNLTHWVERHGRPKVEDAIRMILDVLEGLAHAHKQGYVHRDIKPQNILVDGKGRAVVADFGLAKCFEEAQLWDITKSGTTMGTAAFMPQEQAVNFKRVRPSTDVWAVAAVLYWLLCGVPPRHTPGSKQSFLDVMNRQSPITSIRERVPSLPRPLAELLDTALADDPARRPENAFAFRLQLRMAMGMSFALRNES